MGKLTDLKVKKAGPGIHGDGGGLYLRVKDSGARSWVLRVQVNGKRQDVGLGGYPTDLSLIEAREKAAELRKLARQGKNARDERDRGKVVVPTFAEAMVEAHAEYSKGWSVKHAAAFKASLTQHMIDQPKKKGEEERAPRKRRFGTLRVDQIAANDIVAALAPIWSDKPQIARKVRVRIIQVLDFAKSKGWRADPVPDAREISRGLSRQPRGGNFAAMPFEDVPAFVADQLGKDGTPGRLALLFTIATAARSGEVRSARWEHINADNREWNRPADLLKSGIKHTVTLNDAALSILERAKDLSGGKGLIFPGTRTGKPLSDMTITKALRNAQRAETVHGFRSAFRDWAAERKATVPAMVAEMALAHSVGTKTEQAYLRSDLRDMRRELMEAWGRFIAPSLSISSGNVVTFSKVI